jgi:hypothetical protein
MVLSQSSLAQIFSHYGVFHCVDRPVVQGDQLFDQFRQEGPKYFYRHEPVIVFHRGDVRSSRGRIVPKKSQLADGGALLANRHSSITSAMNRAHHGSERN